MEKSLKKETALIGAGTIAGITATKLFINCGVCISSFIAIVAIAIFVLLAKLNGKKFTRRGLITIIILLLILVPIFGYHRFFCHRPEEEIVNSSVEEETEETEDEEAEENTTEGDQNANEETSNVSNNTKKVYNRGYCPENQKLEATYNNVKPEDASNTVVATTDPSKDEVTFTVENNEEEKKQDEEIKQDVENGKEKTELEEGIIATTDPEKAEEKDLTIKEDTIEIKSEESGETNKEENSSKTEEDFTEANEDELDNLLENTEKDETTEVKDEATEVAEETTEEVVETKVEEQTIVENTKVEEEANGTITVEDVKVEEPKEEITEVSNIVSLDVEEPVIEEVKSAEPVKVTAIDGYTTTVNSTAQFKIDGDDVVIDGLDGIDYTFSNGILNINTGDEATILTVEVSNSVNTVEFDITVNGVVNQ